MLTLLMVLRSRSRKVQGHGNGFHEKCAVAKLMGQFASNWIYRVGMKYNLLWGQGHDHRRVKVTKEHTCKISGKKVGKCRFPLKPLITTTCEEIPVPNTCQ